ncbi:MAG: Fe-S cluster assembly protein SufB [archaeon]
MGKEKTPVKDYSKYGFSKPDQSVFSTGTGINADVVTQISRMKEEPGWMLDIRLKALALFESKPMPSWGVDLSAIEFDKITYYTRPLDKQAASWEELPDNIKDTFDRLGIPEAERKFLAGVGAQYDSEVIYHKTREDLEKRGVIFLDMDSAVREHPEIVKKYFSSIIPASDNKFAALNTAAWSGGSFVYVPKDVKVDIPLQAYFRINAQSMGQFERTLIIAEPGSFVHYIEGCTAPTYSADSLHAAVVEVIAQEDSRIRYTTIQNWSDNIYNLVTKRAIAKKNATVEWIDGNLGSKVTMKYPAVFLMGEGARAEVLSIAFAGKGQILDAGAKAVHMAPKTSSIITNKSISLQGGKTIYRGLLGVRKGAKGSKSTVNCDALILDPESSSDTIPYIEIKEQDVSIGHEATVGKVSEEQLFYLMSRGLSQEEAMTLIVAGFIEPFVKELPLEYAIELNRLIELEMEGSVG